MKNTYDFSELFEGQLVKNFRKKTVIWDAGDEVDGLYCLTSGRIKVSTVTDEGLEYTVNTIGPGDPFPLPLYFAKPAPRIKYTAETAVKAAWLPRAEADAYLHAHPHVLYDIMGLDLTVLYARINTLSRGSAEVKVLKRIIELSERFGKENEDNFEITTTQQELADSVSLSRESVNLMLKKLADKGVLTMSRNKIYMSVSEAKSELSRHRLTARLSQLGAESAAASDLDLV
jgi:CRP-like cAMP-binding protein